MRHHALALAAALAAAPALAQDALSPDMAKAVDERVRAYLLEHPEVILDALDVLESRRQAAEAKADGSLIAEQRQAIYEDGYSHVFGNPKGDVTIVEFADYRCGYCKAAHPHVNELLASDGAIRLIYKEFPILGQDSTLASRVAMAGLAMDPDGYERLHEAMLGHKGGLDEATIFRMAREAGFDEAALRKGMEAPEIADRIRANYGLAQALKIEGTPSFIIGDRVVRGFVQVDTLRQMVADARAPKD
jgi:protein-disulfide isomerase